MNIAYEATERHVAHGRGDRVALRFLGPDGIDEDVTYAMLADRASRFDGVLAALGIQPGERVFGLLTRRPELYAALLGTLRHRAVFCPLFSAFGPEPVRQRLALGAGRVLVTTASLYRRKVAPIRDQLPDLAHVLIAGPGAERITDDGVHDLQALLAEAPDPGPVPPTDPEDWSLLHFTSGTTGKPKGVVHVHEAVVAHHATARSVLDLGDGDVFWCTADPGWVTGTSYGIVAPLTCGVTSIVDEEEFDADRWYADPRGAAGHRLVHRAHRAAHADARRRRARQRARPVRPAPRRERGRAAQPRGGGLGAGGLRQARPRHLVADRDRRDHGRQLRLRRDPPRVDGPAGPRHRGDRAAARRRSARSCSTPTASREQVTEPGVEGELALRTPLAVA